MLARAGGAVRAIWSDAYIATLFSLDQGSSAELERAEAEAVTRGHRPRAKYLRDADPPFAERMVVAVEPEQQGFSQTAECETLRRHADEIEPCVFGKACNTAVEGEDTFGLRV